MIESKLTKTGYELESVHIVQAPISTINHRSECDPTIELCGKRVKTIIVSPMGAVTNEHNYKVWLDNGFICVVPRTVDLDKRLEIAKETFVSFSLNEAEDVLAKLPTPSTPLYVCIDIAHGTMERLYKICKKLKEKYKENMVIMTGNVANPDAYIYYAEAGIDYMRATIGTGSRCVIAGTEITMSDGSTKNIEDIDRGEYVKTMNGPQKVLNTFTKTTNQLVRINGVTCTPDHKFFVIRKSDVTENMSDEDIKSKGVYISAEELNNEYLLVED